MPEEFRVWNKEFWSPEAREEFRRRQHLKTLEGEESIRAKYANQLGDADLQRKFQEDERRDKHAKEMLVENYKQAEAARQAARMNDETHLRDKLTRYYRQEIGPDGNFYPEGGAAANAQYEMDRAALGEVTPSALKGVEAGNRIGSSAIRADSELLRQLEEDYTARTTAESNRRRTMGGMDLQEDVGRETAKAGIERAKASGLIGKYLQQDPELGIAGTQGMRGSEERERVKAGAKAEAAKAAWGMLNGNNASPVSPFANAQVAPPKKPVYQFGPNKVSYDISTNNVPPVTPASQPPDMNGHMRPSFNTTREAPGNLDKIQKRSWYDQYLTLPENE